MTLRVAKAYPTNKWFSIDDNTVAYIENPNLLGLSVDVEYIDYMDNTICAVSILSVDSIEVGYLVYVKMGIVDLLDKTITIDFNFKPVVLPYIEDLYYGKLKLIIADNKAVILTVSHNKSEKYLHT